VRHDYCQILVHYASAVKKIHLIEVRRQKPASLQIAGFFCLDFRQRGISPQNQALAGALPMLCTELSTPLVHKPRHKAWARDVLRTAFVVAQNRSAITY
jgi:hypothetical protein